MDVGARSQPSVFLTFRIDALAGLLSGATQNDSGDRLGGRCAAMGEATNPPNEKATPSLPREGPQIAAATAGSMILRTARPDAENLRSYFFTDALEILATDEMNKIPDIFESVEKALQAGHYVAGFVSYEAGYHFEPAAMRSAGALEKCGVPLVWFGIY